MDTRRLVEILSQLPRTLIEGYELDDVMAQLGDDIAEALGVVGAGVMLEDEHGRLRFLAASDPVLHALERLQIELGEGPCLLAYQSGAEVEAADLSCDERFPRFGPLALEAGMRAVASFPLTYRETILGAINMYDTKPRALSQDERTTARVLADVATAFLLHPRDLSGIRSENRHLMTALKRRTITEQGKGWIRARTGLKEEDAWEALRRYARHHQQRVEEVAARLLDGELDVGELTQDRAAPRH